MTARLDANKTLLAVIDVQGALAEAMSGREALYANLEKLIRGCQLLNLPMVWTEQVPDKLGATIPRIASLLKGQDPIPKSCFSCASDQRFAKALSSAGKAQILLCGIEAHICVLQTAMDLVERKYQVFVVADAVSSREASNVQVALERMREVGAVVVSAEMALFEMLKDATDPRFRDLLRIIK
ncbi:MAG: hydrolase [Nitrospinota bacterium]|nr:hydrolase [Nitrospinota bacterium]MDH5679073.1 hydrolase [Nitrospinota bacterium]MDH5755506.1 hydrolase [Nitrospinota bacterium]